MHKQRQLDETRLASQTRLILIFLRHRRRRRRRRRLLASATTMREVCKHRPQRATYCNA